MILTAVEKTNENAERWTGRHNLADHHLHPGWPSASSSSSLSSPLSSLSSSSSSSSSFLQCFCHYHPRNIMTNIIIIICPGQVLREKNWTDKVTAEMKNFEKSIIKAMRVCAISIYHQIYIIPWWMIPGGWLGWTWRRKQTEMDLPRFVIYHLLFFSNTHFTRYLLFDCILLILIFFPSFSSFFTRLPF